MKILSYLDASSLFCMIRVSKLFHQIASDDIIWHKIYTSEFGSQTWKPKLADDAAPKVNFVEPRDLLAGHWKRMYLTSVAGKEMYKWRNEMKDISPVTGIPKQMERVLRNLNLIWELTVSEKLGYVNVLKQSQVFFLKSSMIVSWSGSCLPKYYHIRSLQLHAVRREVQWSLKAKKCGWHSLISKVDLITQRCPFIGTDGLIKMMHVPPGFIVGIWRMDNSVAFIMVSLHFHNLLERSLLGFPACPYTEPFDRLQVDTSDPELGLCDYTLNLALHDTSTEIMSGHFQQLSCHKGRIRYGSDMVKLKVIDKTNLSQHRPLSGNIELPWGSEELEGSVENCCIMTLTLLDVFQKPFWCVSSPICITAAKEKLSYGESDEHFLMRYRDPEGQVKMGLVWWKEQKQFFIISLNVYIPVSKVNKRFGTDR